MKIGNVLKIHGNIIGTVVGFEFYFIIMRSWIAIPVGIIVAVYSNIFISYIVKRMTEELKTIGTEFIYKLPSMMMDTMVNNINKNIDEQAESKEKQEDYEGQSLYKAAFVFEGYYDGSYPGIQWNLFLPDMTDL